VRLMLYCRTCKKVRKHIPASWGMCFCKKCRRWIDNPKATAPDGGKEGKRE